MNAITTSMRSAEGISASTCVPTRGSPGALVSSVVSSSGISGSAIASELPSGSLASTLRSTSAGSTGRSGARPSAAVASMITPTRRRARAVPTATRSFRSSEAIARSSTRERCIARRSAASASWSSERRTSSAPPNSPSCACSASVIKVS